MLTLTPPKHDGDEAHHRRHGGHDAKQQDPSTHIGSPWFDPRVPSLPAGHGDMEAPSGSRPGRRFAATVAPFTHT